MALIKPTAFKKGDRIAIVSLSSGILGEDFTAHQRHLGEQRLRALGLQPVYMPNACRGVRYLAAHPQARAADLKTAFQDPTIRGVVAAIGGMDTYRIIPYLMEDPAFCQAVRAHPKIFTGFSDTTINHLMLYRLGLESFYGLNFLNDLAELATQMLPYTQKTWERLFHNPEHSIIPSSTIWYEERTDFSAAAIGQPRISHPDYGYQVLRGRGQTQGRLWGGCLDSLSGALVGKAQTIAQRYHLLLSPGELQDKLLFLETSEDCPRPELYRQMLAQLDEAGILAAVRGLLIGKPQNKKYEVEYQAALLAATQAYQTPILYNVNIGHAYPHTVLPYGVLAQVNWDQPRLKILEPWFA